MKVAVFGGDRVAFYKVLEYLVHLNIEIVAVIHEGGANSKISHICEQNGIFSCNASKMYEDLANGVFPQFDLGISYLYGKILKKEIIDFSNNNIINFHPAPTQIHRGIAACCYCLMNDYSEWGVTAHYITPNIDDGEIIQQRKFKIDKHMTGLEAEQFIQHESFLLFREVLQKYINSDVINRKKQDDFHGTYYSKKQLEKDKKINLSDDTDLINKKIRAFWFPPFYGAYIEINGEKYTLVNEEILKKLAAEQQ